MKLKIRDIGVIQILCNYIGKILMVWPDLCEFRAVIGHIPQMNVFDKMCLSNCGSIRCVLL